MSKKQIPLQPIVASEEDRAFVVFCATVYAELMADRVVRLLELVTVPESTLGIGEWVEQERP